MKKSLIAICALVSFAASAAWEQAGTIKVADASTFTKAIAKLGEITGNQMLGAMTMGFFANPPGAEFFGPMRPGAAAMLPVFVDLAALDKDKKGDESGDPVEFAVLYPVVQSKAEFLKAHTDAVETNGLFLVKAGPFFEVETYVGFSPDGKWAAASDKPWQVKDALAEIAEAEKPLGGDLVRICVAEKGMVALRKALTDLTAEAKKNKQPYDNRLETFVASVADCYLGLAVSDMGIDLHGAFKPVAGTEVAKLGTHPLSADPFAFASTNAIIASSSIGFKEESLLKTWKTVEKILKRHGLDLSRFFKIEGSDDLLAMTIDTPAYLKYLQGDATNALEKLDIDKLAEDLMGINAGAGGTSLKIAETPQKVSLTMIGYTPKYSTSARFAATLPEAKGKSLCSATALSLSALLQAVVHPLMATLPEKERAEMAPMLAFLPKETAGGIASMGWRENEEIRMILRISADELKGISSAVTAAMAMASSQKEKDE